MGDRVFAVVNLSDLDGKLNDAGLAVVANARHSNDNTQIILDFNHHRSTIGSLFLEGVDVDAVIAGCQMLNHQQAKKLMLESNWIAEEV